MNKLSGFHLTYLCCCLAGEVELLMSADDPESWEITPSISALYELAEDHRWKAAVGSSAKDSSHDMDGNAVRIGDGFKAFDVGDEPVGGVGGGFPFGDDNDDGSVVDFGGGDDGWNDDGCGFAGPPFAGGGAPGMIPAGESDGENGYSDVDDGMDAVDWLAAGMGMTRLKGSNAWAGPKHWHFVKSKEEAPAAAPEAQGRKKRAAKSELIVFSDPQIDESLFQVPKALKEIQLTKAGRKVVNTLLPKDYHYDGRKLATVFMSSDWNFLARKTRRHGGAKQGFEDGGGVGFAAVGGGDDGFDNDWGGDECADPFDYGDDFDGQGDSAEVKPADDFMEDLVPMPKKPVRIWGLQLQPVLPQSSLRAPHPLLISTHGSFSLFTSPHGSPSTVFFVYFFHFLKTNRLTFHSDPLTLLTCPSSPLPLFPPSSPSALPSSLSPPQLQPELPRTSPRAPPLGASSPSSPPPHLRQRPYPPKDPGPREFPPGQQLGELPGPPCCTACGERSVSFSPSTSCWEVRALVGFPLPSSLPPFPPVAPLPLASFPPAVLDAGSVQFPARPQPRAGSSVLGWASQPP
ncbi:unnamed protein product [Closterium sp. NIES-54]